MDYEDYNQKSTERELVPDDVPRPDKIRRKTGKAILEQMKRVDNNLGRKLKPVTKEQKRRALEFVRTVTLMKSANSKAIRKHEFISNYEQQVIDRVSSGDEPQDKEILPQKC